MGFGWLLIGYLVTFLMSLTLYGWIIRLIGYLIMAIACYKLKDYFPSFIYSFICILILFITGLTEAVVEFGGQLSISADVLTDLSDINSYVRTVLVLLLHILLLLTIRAASGELDLQNMKISAVTDLVAVCVGFIFYILAALGVIVPGVPVLTQIVWSVMVAVLLFRCYARICPEGDENMPRHSSKIPFLDKINEAYERNGIKNNEEAKAEIARRREKLRLKNEKQNETRKGRRK